MSAGFKSKSKLPDASAQQATRLRLMEAAGEVFAKRGFRHATVREICERAGANVASINYHFGDKERLYGELLQYCGGDALKQYPPDMGVAPGDAPEKRLHAFIRAFLLRITDHGRPTWQGKLMAHEMADPTPALDRVVDQVIRPQQQYLAGLLAEILGSSGRVDPDMLRLCASSVIGQCIFYFHARAVIERLFPKHHLDREEIEKLAAHITRFSLEGMRAMRKPGANDSPVFDSSRNSPRKRKTGRSLTAGLRRRRPARKGGRA